MTYFLKEIGSLHQPIDILANHTVVMDCSDLVRIFLFC